MALKILQTPDPYSLASLGRAEDVRLIQSDALRLLIAELRRYCRGEISGRSILLAGHRGGGKTTLVLGALLKVLEEAGEYGHLRPLLVPLHGPSLLPTELPTEFRPEDRRTPAEPSSGENTGVGSVEARDGVDPAIRGESGKGGKTEKNGKDVKGGDGKDPAGSESEKKPVSETQVALEQITVGLYRALAREIASSYRANASYREELQQIRYEQRRRTGLPGLINRLGSPPEQMRLLEMAAQLELELYQQPDPARLRLYWAAAGAQRSGVIPRGSGSSSMDDQGWRELVALTSANQAYLRCIGTLTQSEQQTGSESRKSSTELSWDAAGESLVKPVLTLMSGALAGLGAFQQTGSMPQTGLAALLAAVTAAGVLKLSFGATRERGRTTTLNFVPDTSVATLDRVLPILIDRLIAAGLAPVFMVDELDKVKNLSKRMTDLVHDLKKFVAENAFFCWLTDRTYFEEVERDIKRLAYARESTYFSYRLFIGYSPDDLHAYLKSVFEEPEKPPEPREAEAGPEEEIAAPGVEDGAPAQASPSVPSPEMQEYQMALDNLAEDLKDRDVWPYLLLHRSQMHPIDLHRQIAEIKGPDDLVLVPQSQVRSPRYQADILIQLAIENALDRSDLRDWLSREPSNRRFAYDALYYLSRRWWECGEEVDLTDEGRKDFDKYLVDRLRTENPDPRTAVRGDGGDKEVLEELLQRVLSADDRKILFQVQREIAGQLASSERFLEMLGTWNEERRQKKRTLIPDVLLSMVPTTPANETMPLMPDPGGGQNKFRWRFRPSGLPFTAQEQALSPVPDGDLAPLQLKWQDAMRGIRAVAAMLSRVSS